MKRSKLLKENLEWFISQVNNLYVNNEHLSIRDCVIMVQRDNPKKLGHFKLFQLLNQWNNHSGRVLKRLEELERKKREARTSHEAQQVLVDEREATKIIFTGNPKNFTFELKDDKIVVSCESDGFVMSNI